MGMEELAYVAYPLKAENWSLILYMPKESLLIEQQTMRIMLTILIFGLTLLIIASLVILALGIYSRRINMYIRNLNKNLKIRNNNGSSFRKTKR